MREADGNVMTPCGIASVQDAKVQTYLATRRRTHFWYASCCDASVQRMHALGFDNYPLRSVPFQDSLFFFERLAGCDVRSVDGPAGSFFHTWCEPLLDDPRCVRRLAIDLDGSRLWGSYAQALSARRDSCAQGRELPVPDLAFSPLDWACNLCSAERLFTWMYDATDEVDGLLDRLCDLYLEARQRVAASGLATRNGFGFPCAYCNDLQLANLSPALIERFILPRYERVASQCAGMILALHCHDLHVLERVTRSSAILGCCFDKRLALPDIRRCIGDKLFVICNYAYDDSLDKPTLRDGLYWNPIVQSYSREIHKVYRALADDCSMILLIERPRLDQVCHERQMLLASREHP